MFLDEQRVRLKALVAKNIGSERNVDAFVEAVNMVKTEVENRQKRRSTDGDDGESEGEGEDVAPNYEDMIQNKMKAVKRHQDQNGLDLKDEQLMRKFRERLNEKDDQGDEDEDLEVMNQPGGADSENALKCQITLKRFVKPYRNKVCQHVYEYDAIMNHLRSSRQCPITGCINNTMAVVQLEEDEEMQMKVRRKNRREVEEKQALDRDRDDEEESNDEGDNFGTTVIDQDGIVLCYGGWLVFKSKRNYVALIICKVFEIAVIMHLSFIFTVELYLNCH